MPISTKVALSDAKNLRFALGLINLSRYQSQLVSDFIGRSVDQLSEDLENLIQSLSGL